MKRYFIIQATLGYNRQSEEMLDTMDREEAIRRAQVAWDQMSKHDQKSRTSFWIGFGPSENDMQDVPKIDWLDLIWEAI